MRGENVVHWGGSWSLVCGRREMFERIWRAGKMGIAGASYAAHELYMAMRCIFYLEDRPPSDEHVFPLAIGGSCTPIGFVWSAIRSSARRPMRRCAITS